MYMEIEGEILMSGEEEKKAMGRIPRTSQRRWEWNFYKTINLMIIVIDN